MSADLSVLDVIENIILEGPITQTIESMDAMAKSLAIYPKTLGPDALAIKVIVNNLSRPGAPVINRMSVFFI